MVPVKVREMAKQVTLVEDNTTPKPSAEADPKINIRKKLKKINRRERNHNIQIENVLGDFSMQTGAYF